MVFTAFSGSHQDAIKKCLARRKDDEPWQVAYLPIDPADIGRSYQEVIRINSQSGKGGMAYVLEREYGLELPRWLQIDFSSVVQAYAEEHKTEVGGAELYRLFEQHYLACEQGMTLERFSVERAGAENVTVSAVINDGAQSRTINGKGGGVVSAFVTAMQPLSREKIVLVEYSEHALSHSADAEAVSYIQLNLGGERYCGVGRSHDIVQASLSAILGAMNKAALENTQAA
ncbi:MAG: hypothetical protein CSA53_01300 [Gammaproteobacteria bacterium]|nr:MAG: hypothetical protein CSA53_01300 [Gammaproteobacteria bacterium]